MPWLQDRLDDLGKSQADFARHLKTPPSRVSEMIAGNRRMQPHEIKPASEFLELPESEITSRLAGPREALSTGRVTRDTTDTPSYLKSNVRRTNDEATRLNFEEMPKDVPIYGTVSGGPGGLQMSNGHVLDYVRRPPRFKDRKGTPTDVFAVIVEDISMTNRFEPGDLVYVDRLWPPNKGDYVIVEIQEGEHAEPKALLKKLVDRTATKITLEQFNPPKKFDVSIAHVKRLYRALLLKEIMGV